MIQVAEQAFRPEQRSFSAIDRDEIVRQTLDEVERRLIYQQGNSLYRQAWKVAIRIMQGMRP